MRVELLLELSGLTRQEVIVIKACAPDAKPFESVAATLVEQYSGVHLREGRSLQQQDVRKSGHSARSGKFSGYRTGKGKGKTYRAYTADAWYYEEEDYPGEDQDQEVDYNEAFEDETAQGPEAGKSMRTTSYPSPKLLPATALRNSSWTCCTVAVGSSCSLW